MLNSVDILKINLENAMFNKLNDSLNKNESPAAASFADIFDNAVGVPRVSNTPIVSEPQQVGSMRASSNLVKFIENHEGFASTAYNGVDYWNDTIGYGHVVMPGENITSLSEEGAQNLLKNDLTTYEASVNKEFADTKLSQNQFDALVSFAYGLGANIWSKTPQLVNDIKSGAPAETIKADFERCSYCGGNIVKGLVNRRSDEADVFNSGIY